MELREPSLFTAQSCLETVKPQEMIDTRYLDETEKSGFFEQIWAGKR